MNRSKVILPILLVLIVVMTACVFVACEDVVGNCDHTYKYEIIDNPTMDEPGKATVKCGKCDTEFEIVIPTLGEVSEEWEWVVSTTTAATCTEEGVDTYICVKPYAGLKVELTTPIKEHEFGELVEEVPSTCLVAGTMAHYECSVCHKYFDSEKNAVDSIALSLADHKYGNLIDEVPSTCVVPGTMAHYECSECGKNFDANKKPVDSIRLDLGDHTYGDLISGTAADCIHGGTVDHYICGECDKVFDSEKHEVTDINTEALGHAWDEGSVTTPATCTTDGVKTYTCTRDCGETKTEVIEALGHTEETIEGTEATCTTSGLTDGTRCSVCGVTLVSQEVIEALGHDWDEGKVTTEATCTSEGVKTFTCTRGCGETKTESIDMIGHAWDDGVVIKDATCTEDGSIEYTCGTCGDKRTEVIEATGHTEVEIPAVQVTCTTDGWTAGVKCSVCDEILVKPERIPAEGHIDVSVPGKEPTCTETGLTEGVKCMVCGEILEAQQEIPALGHAWDEGTETTAPTCTAEGVMTYHCTRCDVTATEVTPALGHAWGEWTVVKAATCTEKGSEQRVCAHDAIHVETRETDPIGHAIDEGVVTTEPTCTTEGVKTVTCTNGCGLTTTEVIEALGHAWGEWTVVKAATCTEKGSEQRVCAHDASHVETRETDPIGHAMDEGVVTTEPTCTTEGVKTVTCTNGCGLTTTEAVPALGHAWGEWTVVKAATCTEKGLEQRVCANDANHVEERPIEALGHAMDDTYTVVVEPTLETEGTYQHKCNNCGATKDVTVPALSDTTVWAVSAEDEPTHENAGSRTYNSIYGEVTIVLDKLHYAFENQTYVPAEFDAEEATNKAINAYMWSGASFSLDGEGNGEGTAHPFRGKIEFRMVNVATGEIAIYFYTNQQTQASKDEIAVWDEANDYTPGWGSESPEGRPEPVYEYVLEKTFVGYVDAESGLVVFGYNALFTDVYVLSPFETPVSGSFKASAWDGTHMGMAITYTHNETAYNVLVMNGVVHFGVEFNALDGTAIPANEVFNAEVVSFVKGSTEIVTLGYDGTHLVTLDGYQGVYTDSDAVNPDLALNGLGGFTWGDKSGTYTVNNGLLEMYVVADGINKEYYETVAMDGTYTAEKPEVTVIFDFNGFVFDGVAPSDTIPLNKNIPYTLPIYTNATQAISAWTLENGDIAGENGILMPTEDLILTAVVGNLVQINLQGVLEGDPTVVTTGAGVTLRALLPNYVVGETVNDLGHKFLGWFVDIDGEMINIELTAEVTEDDSGATIIAMWQAPPAIVGTYTGWNLHQNNTSGTKTLPTNEVTTIGEDGKVGPGAKLSGTVDLVAYKDLVDGSLTIGGKYVYFNDEMGILWYAWGSSTTGVNNDTQLMVTDRATSIVYSGKKGSSTYIAFVTINYNDNTSKNALLYNNRVYANVSWNEGVTAIDAISSSNLTIKNSEGEAIFGYVSGKIVELDGIQGTYTSEGKSDLVLDGVGGFTWGDKSGTYAYDAEISTTSITMYVVENGENKEFYTVELSGSTYTATKTMVTVTFDYNGVTPVEEHSATKEYNKNIATTLPTYTNATNVFRGWYLSTDDTKELIDLAYTPIENVTLVAKWDTRVTLTVVLGNGLETVEMPYGIGDTTAPVEPDGMVGGKIFGYWYTSTDDGATVDAIYTPGKIEANTTIYAQWREPYAFSNKTYRVIGVGNYSTKLEAQGVTFTFDARGKNALYDTTNTNYPFGSKAALEIFYTNEETGDAIIKEEYMKEVIVDWYTGETELQHVCYYYYAYVDKATGIIFRGYSSRSTIEACAKADLDGSTLYVLVPDDGDITAEHASSMMAGSIRMVKYIAPTSGKVIGMYLNGTDVALNVSFKDIIGNEVVLNEKAKQSVTLMVHNVANEVIASFGYNGSKLVALDGSQAVYTVVDGTDKFVVNGYGYATLNGVNCTYETVEGTNVFDVYVTVDGSDVYYEVTVDTVAKTYTVDQPEVNVTYVTGDHASLEQYVFAYAKNNVIETLGAPAVSEGYEFLGWYFDAEYTKPVDATFKPSADTSIYAKVEPVPAGANADNAVELTYTNGILETEVITTTEQHQAYYFLIDVTVADDYYFKFDKNITGGTAGKYYGRYIIYKQGENEPTSSKDMYGYGDTFAVGESEAIALEKGKYFVKVDLGMYSSTASAWGTFKMYMTRGENDTIDEALPYRLGSTAIQGATDSIQYIYSVNLKSGVTYQATYNQENRISNSFAVYTDDTLKTQLGTALGYNGGTFTGEYTPTADGTYYIVAQGKGSFTFVDPNAPVLTVLATPVVTISESGLVSWEAVDGAAKYQYRIDNGQIVETTDTSVQLTAVGTIKVWAVGDGVTTDTSDPATATFELTALATPVVTVDKAGVASWTAVENATGYSYTINGGDAISTTETSVQLADDDTIVVVAVGAFPYGNSADSEPVTYHYIPKLSAPELTVAGDGVVTVGTVEGAVKYQYQIGDGEILDVTETPIQLVDGQSIKVWAVGDGVTGETSDPATASYATITLATPVVTVDKAGLASWTAVENASGYSYTINGGDAQTTTETSVQLSDGNTIVVTAIGELPYVNSAESDPVTYTYVAAPAIVGEYTGWNFFQSSTNGTKTFPLSTKTTIGEDGSVSGNLKGTVDLSVYGELKDGSLVIGGTYVYFNDEMGIIWYNYDKNKPTTIGDDTYLMLAENVTSVEYSGKKYSGKYLGFITVTYDDGTIKNALLYNDTVYANVSWKEGVSATKACTTYGMVIKNSAGVGLYGYVSGSIVALDGIQGTYTSEGKSDLVLDGLGGFTWGEKSGKYTYKADVSANSFTMFVVADGKNSEFWTVELSGSTFTAFMPMATITYDYSGVEPVEAHSATEQYNKNIAITLPTYTNDTHVFRGWYVQGDESQKLIDLAYTPLEDVTLVAKWDSRVTLTLVLGNGLEPVVMTYGLGDTTNPAPHEPATVVNGQIFDYWYTSTDDGATIGEIYTPGKIEANTTIYAHWRAPYIFSNKTYRVFSVGSNSNKSLTYQSVTFRLNARGQNGVYNTTSTNAPFVKDAVLSFSYINEETNEIVIKQVSPDGKTIKYYYGLIDPTTGIIYRGYSSKTSAEACTKADINAATLYVIVPDNGEITDENVNNISAWAFKMFTYTAPTSGIKYGTYYENGSLTFNVTFKDIFGAEVDLTSEQQKALAIYAYNSENTVIASYGWDGSKLVALNGSEGVYTLASGSEQFVVNGVGIATLNGVRGTASKVGETNVYDVYVKVDGSDVYYEVTVDTAAMSYTVTQPSVTVTYVTGDHATLEQYVFTVAKNNVIDTLAAPAVSEGYEFLGWYFDAEYTEKVDATFKPSADMSIYAKVELVPAGANADNATELTYTSGILETEVITTTENHQEYYFLIDVTVADNYYFKFSDVTKVGNTGNISTGYARFIVYKQGEAENTKMYSFETSFTAGSRNANLIKLDVAKYIVKVDLGMYSSTYACWGTFKMYMTRSDNDTVDEAISYSFGSTAKQEGIDDIKYIYSVSLKANQTYIATFDKQNAEWNQLIIYSDEALSKQIGSRLGGRDQKIFTGEYTPTVDGTYYIVVQGKGSFTFAPKAVKLATPVVSVNCAGVVTWAEVANATGYEYSINGGAAVPTTATTVTINANDTITVVAVGDGVSFTNSDSSAVVTANVAHTEEPVAGTPATCTESGMSDGKVCSVCGATLQEQTVLPALGHDMVTDSGKAATCTEAGLTDGSHCSRCDYAVAQTEIPALGHDMVTDSGKAATCTEAGLTDGSHCSRCDYTVAQTEIPALGHDMVTDSGKAATCTEAGLTDGSHCSRCDYVVAQTEIPALGHDMVTDSGKAATCTETGLTDGSHCSRCDFVVAQEEIPAKGHTVVAISDKAPTCTENGSTGGTKCSVCGITLVEATVVPALGHSLSFELTTNPTETAQGVATASCANCDYVDENYAVAELTDTTYWTLSETVDAQVGVAGHKTYTSTIYNRTVTVEIEALPLVVHYYNAKPWTTINAYAWKDSVNNGWPGVSMNADIDNDGWYTLELDKFYTMIQFNDGTDAGKTADLTLDYSKLYYNGVEWVSEKQLHAAPVVTVNDTAVEAVPTYEDKNSGFLMQYAFTMTLNIGDVVAFTDGENTFTYEVACGFTGTTTRSGEYTFYAKINHDFSRTIWVETPALVTTLTVDETSYNFAETSAVEMTIGQTATIANNEGVSFEFNATTPFAGTATVNGLHTFTMNEDKTISVSYPGSTQENPMTVAQAIVACEALENNVYSTYSYYINGVIVAPGKVSTTYNNVTDATIADTADGTTIELYRVSFSSDDAWKQLHAGDHVAILGYLQKFVSDSGAVTLEIASATDKESNFLSITHANSEYVNAAADALVLDFTEVSTATPLPTSVEIGGQTIAVAWASSVEGFVVDNATVVPPTTTPDVTLTATLSYNGETTTKDFTGITFLNPEEGYQTIVDKASEEFKLNFTEVNAETALPTTTTADGQEVAIAWEGEYVNVNTLTLPATGRQKTTIMATFTYQGKTATNSYDIVVSATDLAPRQLGWVKVTDIKSLSDGDIIIIGAKDSFVMGAQNGKYREKVDFNTANEDSYAKVKVIINTDSYTLQVENEGYLGASGTDLKIDSDLEKATKWTIEIATDGVATIYPVGSASNKLQYNPGSPRFKIYTSKQTAVSIYKQATILDTPDVTISETGVATWTEVLDATGYMYSIDGGEYQAATGMSVQLTSRQTISVIALGSIAYANSVASEAKEYIVIEALAAPVITIQDNGVATWEAVTNATGYKYKINDGAEQTAEAGDQVKLTDGQTITVIALGDGKYYSDSSSSETYTAPADLKPTLATPVVEVADDGTATWEAVPNALSYTVKVNGVEQSTTALTVTLQEGDTIQVKAIGQSVDGVIYLNSDFSAEQTYVKASSLTETIKISGKSGTLASDSKSITWDIGNFTVTNYKEGSSSAIYTTDTDLYRVYAKSKLEITAKSGNMTQIVFTCSSAKYATALAKDLGVTASGSTVTITLENSATFSVTVTAQTRIKSMEITYAV